MKGFAATPVIFIGVFLITAILFLHFMDIDKQVAEGVGKEARLRKLEADALKNQTAGANELYFCLLYGKRTARDQAALTNNVNLCMNRTVSVVNDTSGMSGDYNYSYNAGPLIDAVLNRTITVTEKIK